jgi:hypothetical protein
MLIGFGDRYWIGLDIGRNWGIFGVLDFGGFGVSSAERCLSILGDGYWDIKIFG